MKPTKVIPSNRRKFLLAAGLGTAGVAATVVATTRPALKTGEAQPAPRQGDGYHASEHILKYYKTTEV
jgi:hypothetical protein